MDKVSGIKQTQTIHRDFISKADSAIESKQNFSVLGFKIGRPGFMQDKKGIERIQRSQQMADEMMSDLLSALAKAFQPRQ